MNKLAPLIGCAGHWQGNNRLQDPYTNPPDDSAGSAEVVPLLDGRFTRNDCAWSFRSRPQAGLLLSGYETETAAARGQNRFFWDPIIIPANMVSQVLKSKESETR